MAHLLAKLRGRRVSGARESIGLPGYQWWLAMLFVVTCICAAVLTAVGTWWCVFRLVTS